MIIICFLAVFLQNGNSLFFSFLCMVALYPAFFFVVYGQSSLDLNGLILESIVTKLGSRVKAVAAKQNMDRKRNNDV